MKLSVSTSIAALLLLSLGAACGDDADANGNSNGAGNVDGAAGTTDGGGKADANARDTGTPTAPFAVNLGAAGNYVILAKSGISTVPTSAITGDIGVSPAAASYITGFDLRADATTTFASSTQVVGKVFASDYAAPTPSSLTTAIADMETAFTDAAGRAPKATELGAGNIGGMTLSAGVYKWGTGLIVPTDLTLAGSATDVWIFQIAQGLTVSSATKVVLSGGAAAGNVYWQVSGAVDLDTTSHFEGTILSHTSIALHTGASINGRLFAQTAVTLEGNTVNAK